MKDKNWTLQGGKIQTDPKYSVNAKTNSMQWDFWIAQSYANEQGKVFTNTIPVTVVGNVAGDTVKDMTVGQYVLLEGKLVKSSLTNCNKIEAYQVYRTD